MRVLITSPIFPPDLGGPAVYTPSIARFLVERGHAVKVVAFCEDPDPVGYPFEIEIIERGFLPLRYLKAFFAVWRSARRADVVYVQEHLALLHVFAARLARRPVVIRMMVDGAWEISHRRGWIGLDDIDLFGTKRYGFRVNLARRLQKLWWSWCRHIIACSEYLRQIAVRRYGEAPDKVRLVHNAYHGVRAEDLTYSRAEARAQLDLDPDRRYLLTICRLVIWKGVHGIIRALSRLPADTHLLIAGEGPMEEEWKRLTAELALEDRVRFLGNVPYAKIPLLIRAADVFVLNSEYEGLSHTLLEVLTLGTPVVCTGVCGNPELVADGVNGLLVEPRDPDGLRTAIARLLREEQLGRRLAEEGVRLSSRFTREATFPLVEDLLEEATRARTDGRPVADPTP